jgi:hypothetical protein
MSRNAHRRGISGAASTLTFLPFRWKEIAIGNEGKYEWKYVKITTY